MYSLMYWSPPHLSLSRVLLPSHTHAHPVLRTQREVLGLMGGEHMALADEAAKEDLDENDDDRD